MKGVESFIERYSAMLPVSTSISYVEAEKRASEFLVALAKITDWRHMLGEEKIKLTSVQTAVYAEKLATGKDKTVTVNKINAEADADYTAAREELERVENDLVYLKAYYDIFNNAHIFYRTMAKGVNE